MRLLHIVELISLTGSVIASPTPSDSKASAPKRLVVCAEDNFQGPSLEIEATNRCVRLEAPVYKNLHSYGVVNQVCYFMDSEKCNSKKLFSVDAKGTESWGRVDVGGVNGNARRVAAVYCSDKAAKQFEADTSTAEADSTVIESRDKNAALFESGYVEACKFNQAGSNSAMGPCIVVQAYKKCKAFGSDFEKKIDVITQGRNCICTYWENTSCKGRYVVESHSGDGDHKPDMGHGGSEGHKISAVSCVPNGFSESVETRAVEAVASPPGSVRACRTDAGSTSCVTKQALNACKSFRGFFANHIDSVFQGSKSTCTYWKSKDCTQGIVDVHNVGEGEVPLQQGGITDMEMKGITAVSCKNISSAQVQDAGHIRTIHTDAKPHNSIRSSPQTTDIEQPSFPPDGGDPGTIQVCTEYAFQAGSCKTYNVMNLCLALPQQMWRIVRSYNQAKGAHCEYYGGQTGCNEVRARVETPDGQFWQAYNYDQIGFTHIWCTKLDSPELDQGAGNLTPTAPTEKRDLVHARDDKPGSVTVCSQFMFQIGSCETYNVLNLCLALPQKLWRNVKSLAIAKGAHCEFYGDEHGCRYVRVRYDLDKHGESDGYVHDDVGYTHVWCTPLHSAELEQTAANSPPTEKREPVPAMAAPVGREGQVLVSSWDSLRGKTQLVDTTTDDNNCAPLFNQIFWNLQSLLQYKGSVCTYWQYNCGKLSGEDKPNFTIDSRKGDVQHDHLPPSFGENRNKISYIMCINALLADEYMAKVDPADPTVYRAPAASDIATRSPGVITLTEATKLHWRPDLTDSPLWVCHNPNMAGQCFAYTGQCAPNPFNVDAIESLWLAKGWRCALYGVWDCDGNKGIPHYVDSRDGEIIINDLEYQIWSIKCAPSPY